MKFLPANAQHIGDRRTQQDSFGFGDPDQQEFVDHAGFIAVVCDGMGGMEFGDAASRTATRSFLDAYQQKTVGESIPAALERSVRKANDDVVALAHSYGLTEGMGTTLVAAAFHRSSMYYISVGDSGLFLARGGNLPMLNRHHVFANVLDAAVARGTLARSDAETHPERESLTSFIGAETLDEIDRNMEPFPLDEGDAVLLASDGLFKTLSTSEMLACLGGHPQTWPDTLVEQTLAKRREHQDNVTVLSIAAEPDEGRSMTDILQTRRPTTIRPGGASVMPPSVTAFPAPTLTEFSAPVLTMPTPPVPISGGSRSPVMLIVAIVTLALVAGGAWWFFHQHQKSVLTANPGVTEPSGAVTTPPRAPDAKPREIKVDPDAPVARPVETTVPGGKR